MRRRVPNPPVILAVLAIAVAMGIVPVSNVAVRALCTLPLVLVLPGYTLVEAVFPVNTLEGIERLLFSLGISIAVAIVCGLVLNWTPWGLQATAWAISLGGVTLGAHTVAARRRAGAACAARQSHIQIQLDARPWILFGVAVAIAAGAIVVARAGAARQQSPGFTQLWMVPSGTTDRPAARLGVRDMETRVERVRLRITLGRRVVREWPLLTLHPGGTWETALALPTTWSSATPVEAKLYRSDDPTVVYSRVVLWRDRRGR